MYLRLRSVSRELESLGLRHRSSHRVMLERLAGEYPVAPLSTLSDILEPVKEYAREKARQYTQFTPLNRLVDATFPESDTAREFSALVDETLSGGTAAQAARDRVRELLLHWRANHAALAPVLKSSFLLEEIQPLSEDVASLAQAGIEALDYLAGQTRPPESWTRRQLALIESAAKPRAELLIMIAPPVQKLIEAANALR